MKIRTLVFALTLALAIAISAAAAPAKSHSHRSGDSKMSGTIVSSSNTELVLSAKVNGKTEEERFVINPQTKTSGPLASGERATVNYKNQNGQKVATMISASKTGQSKSK